MVEPSRYNVSDEEAGLKGPVLKNILGITDQQELEDTESVLLADAYQHFFTLLQKDEIRFNTNLIFKIHKYFLDPLYDWAGELRTVDISKEGILFASVRFLEDTIQELDKMISQNIPTTQDSIEIVAQKLAIIHNEYNAIHPFRDGNGRTVRLFLDLLAAHAGYQPIEYDVVSHDEYIEACKAGMIQNHTPMTKVIQRGLKAFS